MSMPGDITFNSGTSWWGANLTAFVQNGTIASSRVDDMAERIIAAWYLLGQDKNYPDGTCIRLPLVCFPQSALLTDARCARAVSFNAFFPNDPATNEHVDVQADHFKVVREIGAASTVLLKNVDGALPLSKPKSVAIIGAFFRPSVAPRVPLRSDCDGE